MNDKPSIGRIVHVVGDEVAQGEHIAAIITGVTPGTLDVTLFIAGTVAVPAVVGIDNYGDQPGQWHFPERV